MEITALQFSCSQLATRQMRGEQKECNQDRERPHLSERKNLHSSLIREIWLHECMCDIFSQSNGRNFSKKIKVSIQILLQIESNHNLATKTENTQTYSY